MAGKRDDRRVEFTKMLLRESLAGLMRSKPIQKITIKEICETAALNRGTFYSHFSDQYDLLRHTEDVEMETVGKFVMRIATGSMAEREPLCAELFRHIREHSGVWGSLLSENGSADFSRRMFDKLFSDLVEAGVCRTDDPSFKLRFTFLMVGCIGMASRWLPEEPTVSPEQMGKILYGILSENILGG